MKLSIVIPAHNEEKRILPTLREYVSFFSNKYKKNYEIIVVLNACTDNTLNLVKQVSKKHSQVKFVDIKKAIGKGGAIMQGFKLAEGQLIGFVDADNATKADAFNDLIENLNKYDGIVASRWIKGAKINKKQKISRRIASRTFNLIIRFLFGIKIRDTQCGAKLFKKEAIVSIVNELGTTQWAFDINLLYLLNKKGFKTLEIPTVWYDQDDSKLKIGKASFEMFLAILRLRLLYSPFNFVVRAYNELYRLFVR